MRYSQSLIDRVVRRLSLGCFLFYLLWNAAWIAKGQIPPSILKALTGLPCPTSGGCRSLLALCRGEFYLSFCFNPLLLVYLSLFIYSLTVLLRQRIGGRRLVLSPWLAWAWCAALLVGWAAKFALGNKYW